MLQEREAKIQQKLAYLQKIDSINEMARVGLKLLMSHQINSDNNIIAPAN